MVARLWAVSLTPLTLVSRNTVLHPHLVRLGTAAIACAVLALASSISGSETAIAAERSPMAATVSMPLNVWLATGRADIVAGIQQSRWSDVFGQFLKENAPTFLHRPDVAAALARHMAWTEVEAQWLRENAPSFWARPDVQRAWFAFPPRKIDIIGQYLKENGAAAYLVRGSRSLHVLGVSASGSLFYAARATSTGAWSGFVDLSTVAGVPARVSRVAAVVINGNLHVVIATDPATATEAGQLYYAMRRPDGMWEKFINLSSRLSVPSTDYFLSVSATNVGGDLDVAAVTAAGHGALYYAIQHSSNGSWTGFTQVDVLPLGSVAAVGINSDLYLVATTNRLAGDPQVWLGIRHANGSWQPFGQIVPPTVPAGIIGGLAAAGVNGNLEVLVGTDSAALYEATRNSAGGAWSGFDNVSAPGVLPLRTISCAMVDGRLTALFVDNSPALYIGTKSGGAWSAFDNVATQGASVPGGLEGIAAAA